VKAMTGIFMREFSLSENSRLYTLCNNQEKMHVRLMIFHFVIGILNYFVIDQERYRERYIG